MHNNDRGEAYLPGYGSPDFVVYGNTIEHWNDGESISESEKQEILRQVMEEAELRCIEIEIE